MPGAVLSAFPQHQPEHCSAGVSCSATKSNVLLQLNSSIHRQTQQALGNESWRSCWKEAMCTDDVPCRFEGNGEGIVCGVERDTQRQIMEHLSEDSVVLEVGARFGTVSCAISKRQGHSGLRVSIEPDADAFDTLNANADRNNCKGLQVNGVVSQMNATMDASGYGVMAKPDINGAVKGFSPESLQGLLSVHSKRSVKFTALVMDCEGCGFEFLQEHTSFLESNDLKTVFVEADPKIRGGNVEKNWLSYLEEFVPLMCTYGFDLKRDEINTTCCPGVLHHLVFKRAGTCALMKELKGLSSLEVADPPSDSGLIYVSS